MKEDASRARRALLVAESELNRAHLIGDIVRVAGVARGAVARTKQVGSMLAPILKGLAAFVAVGRGMGKRDGKNRSVWDWVRAGLEMAVTVWLSVRTDGRVKRE